MKHIEFRYHIIKDKIEIVGEKVDMDENGSDMSIKLVTWEDSTTITY